MHRRGEGVRGQRGGVLTCPIFETAGKKLVVVLVSNLMPWFSPQPHRYPE